MLDRVALRELWDGVVAAAVVDPIAIFGLILSLVLIIGGVVGVLQ